MKAYSLSDPSASPRARWDRFIANRLPNIVIGLMVVVFCVIVLYPYMAITVPSGQVGVLWKRFGGIGIYCFCIVGRGTVLAPSELRDEGLHVIWPWDELFRYDLRLQTSTQTYNAISKDGVSLTATISVRFQVKHDSVAQLHKFIGPGYLALVVGPEIGSRAREIIARYTAEEVYSTSRQAIEEAIHKSAQERLARHLDELVQTEASDQFLPLAPKMVRPDLKNAIQILDTLVLGIELPSAVVAAINQKIQQLYIAQEYVFRVDREQKESERKRIEAAGIRDFQQIVSQGISDSYLRWRGIEATLQMAQSNNAKVVIIGSGRDGLPIILGNVDSPQAPPPAASPGAAPLPGTTPLPGDKRSDAGSAPPPDRKPLADTTDPAPAEAQSNLRSAWSNIESTFLRLPWAKRSTDAEIDSPPKPTPGLANGDSKQ